MDLFTMLSLLIFLAVSSAPQDWPQHLGPARNGAAPAVRWPAAWGESGPRVIFRIPLGAGLSGPVVAGERLVVFHRQEDEEILECWNALEGKPLWRQAAPTTYRDSFGAEDDGPRSTPAIAGKRVFALGAGGTVRAVDLEQGRLLWSFDARERIGGDPGYFGFACSPLVAGERVIFHLGGTEQRGIVALDAGTGKLLWGATGDEAGYSSPVLATLGGEPLLVCFTRAGLRVLAPETGALRASFPWRARIAASVNAATPVVAGNLIFLTASYGTGAALLEWKDGALTRRWSSDEILSAHYATPVLSAGVLHGLDGRVDSGSPVLRAVELETGKILWTGPRQRGASLLLAGEHLLVLDEDGHLSVGKASRDGYKAFLTARILGSTPVRALPALVGARLYARDRKELVCLDLEAGPQAR